MTMMQQDIEEDKVGALKQLEGLRVYIRNAAQAGSAAHEVEQTLFRGVLALGRELLGHFFQLTGDGDQGPRLTLSDGREVKRLEALHRRTYQSVFGDFQLERCVYGSRESQRIACVPLDHRLQLPEHEASYLLQDWSQSLAVELSHRQTSAALEKVLGIEVRVSQLERMNRTMAGTVSAYTAATPAAMTPRETFLVASADGKGVVIRQPSGSPAIARHDRQRGPKPERKKVAIVGAVYASAGQVRTPEQVWAALFQSTWPTAANDAPPPPRPKPIDKAVQAQLTRVNEQGVEVNARVPLFAWLSEQLCQRDPSGKKPVVVLMDGQHCLWDDAQALGSARRRVEILDLLHATSKLWEAVHAFHPSGSDAALTLMKLCTMMLLRGEVHPLSVWLRHQAEAQGLGQAKRQTVEAVCGYFDNHQQRMRYDRYLAAGYPIASGVIEGACRHVVKDRLERSGMRWTIAGAQAMLDLRCVAINEQWDAFVAFRIRHETQRLYPHRAQFEGVEWPTAIAA